MLVKERSVCYWNHGENCQHSLTAVGLCRCVLGTCESQGCHSHTVGVSAERVRAHGGRGEGWHCLLVLHPGSTGHPAGGRGRESCGSEGKAEEAGQGARHSMRGSGVFFFLPHRQAEVACVCCSSWRKVERSLRRKGVTK